MSYGFCANLNPKLIHHKRPAPENEVKKPNLLSLTSKKKINNKVNEEIKNSELLTDDESDSEHLVNTAIQVKKKEQEAGKHEGDDRNRILNTPTTKSREKSVDDSQKTRCSLLDNNNDGSDIPEEHVIIPTTSESGSGGTTVKGSSSKSLFTDPSIKKSSTETSEENRAYSHVNFPKHPESEEFSSTPSNSKSTQRSKKKEKLPDTEVGEFDYIPGSSEKERLPDTEVGEFSCPPSNSRSNSKSENSKKKSSLPDTIVGEMSYIESQMSFLDIKTNNRDEIERRAFPVATNRNQDLADTEVGSFNDLESMDFGNEIVPATNSNMADNEESESEYESDLTAITIDSTSDGRSEKKDYSKEKDYSSSVISSVISVMDSEDEAAANNSIPDSSIMPQKQDDSFENVSALGSSKTGSSVPSRLNEFFNNVPLINTPDRFITHSLVQQAISKDRRREEVEEEVESHKSSENRFVRNSKSSSDYIEDDERVPCTIEESVIISETGNSDQEEIPIEEVRIPSNQSSVMIRRSHMEYQESSFEISRHHLNNLKDLRKSESTEDSAEEEKVPESDGQIVNSEKTEIDSPGTTRFSVSNGMVNISAKIKINIQINELETSSGSSLVSADSPNDPKHPKRRETSSEESSGNNSRKQSIKFSSHFKISTSKDKKDTPKRDTPKARNTPKQREAKNTPKSILDTPRDQGGSSKATPSSRNYYSPRVREAKDTSKSNFDSPRDQEFGGPSKTTPQIVYQDSPRYREAGKTPKLRDQDLRNLLETDSNSTPRNTPKLKLVDIPENRQMETPIRQDHPSSLKKREIQGTPKNVEAKKIGNEESSKKKVENPKIPSSSASKQPKSSSKHTKENQEAPRYFNKAETPKHRVEDRSQETPNAIEIVTIHKETPRLEENAKATPRSRNPSSTKKGNGNVLRESPDNKENTKDANKNTEALKRFVKPINAEEAFLDSPKETKSVRKKPTTQSVKKNDYRTPAKRYDAGTEVSYNMENLMNELYGDQWKKTPAVMDSVRKVDKQRKMQHQPKMSIGETNFSIFERKLCKDLESTRLSNDASPEKKVKEVEKDPPIVTSPHFKRKQETPAKLKKIVGRTKPETPRYLDIVDSDSFEESAEESDDSWKCTDDENDSESVYSGSDDEDVHPKQNVKTKKHSISRSKVVFHISDDDEPHLSREEPIEIDEREKYLDMIDSFVYKPRPVLGSVETNTEKKKTKRKLFTHRHFEFDQDEAEEQVKAPAEEVKRLPDDSDDSNFAEVFKKPPINKKLEAIKGLGGEPSSRTPSSTKIKSKTPAKKVETPKTASKVTKETAENAKKNFGEYGFLQSLDVTLNKSFCHPDAIYYRNNFKTAKYELTDKLFKLYNEKVFESKLNIEITWNKKLTNTAGRCCNTRKLGERKCRIELSDKVLTSADRLRCTLIHELCHASTWIFNAENGHGSTWKGWAAKANKVFPELPKISVCHSYAIEYKYTYQCRLCKAKYNTHSKTKKVENIRCSICKGTIDLFLNKKDKNGQILQTPVREATGFAKFVKEKYKEVKNQKPDLKHGDVMKELGALFGTLTVEQKRNY